TVSYGGFLLPLPGSGPIPPFPDGRPIRFSRFPTVGDDRLLHSLTGKAHLQTVPAHRDTSHASRRLMTAPGSIPPSVSSVCRPWRVPISPFGNGVVAISASPEPIPPFRDRGRLGVQQSHRAHSLGSGMHHLMYY